MPHILEHFYLCYLSWLGKRDLFQLFPDEVLTDDEQIRYIHEIRRLLDENSNTDIEATT